MTMNIKFGLIGGGVMAEALLSRLIAIGTYQPSEIIVSEPQGERRSYLEQKYGISVTTENSLVLGEAQEAVMLAVKPQIFTTVAQELADILPPENPPVIISILAGVNLKQLEAAFSQFPIIRSMPNTPATVGAGITAISLSAYTYANHKQIAEKIFAAVGEVVEVSETLMDAVTGLSGSGPAYVALMIEALADGGVAVGLTRAMAQQLAIQTVLGTAKLLQETKIHPAELKDRVTSPGGTTIAGVSALEKAGFRSAVMEAVKASKERAQELGNG